MSDRLIQSFNQRVDQGTLTDDVRVIYRMSGGMPHQAVAQEIVISGMGSVSLRDQKDLRTISPQIFAITPGESLEIFRLIRSGLDRLPTRSEARFLPDSLLGAITVEVNGEEETFYFLVEEVDRTIQNKAIPSEISEAIQRLAIISQRTRQ